MVSVISGKVRAGNAARWATRRAKRPLQPVVVYIRRSKVAPLTGTPVLAAITCMAQCWEHTAAPDTNGGVSVTRPVTKHLPRTAVFSRRSSGPPPIGAPARILISCMTQSWGPTLITTGSEGNSDIPLQIKRLPQMAASTRFSKAEQSTGPLAQDLTQSLSQCWTFMANTALSAGTWDTQHQSPTGMATVRSKTSSTEFWKRPTIST